MATEKLIFNSDRTIRLVHRHESVETPDSEYEEYHEWYVTKKRIHANKNGVNNPRMYSANWVEALCNNPDCPAVAYINIEVIIEKSFPISHCLSEHDYTAR